MTRGTRPPKKPSSPTKKRPPAAHGRPPEGSAQKRPSRTITLSPEAIGMLEAMARESGMSKSGVVEALIERARIGLPPNVLTPAEPTPAPPPPPPADPVAEPAPAREPRKKKWADAVREFREMRERMRK